MRVLAINWNNVPDPLDKQVWDRLTGNFWLPEKIAVSNDLTSWRNLTPAEQTLVKRVFVCLTAFDTDQSSVGVPVVRDILEDFEQPSTPFEVAVCNNIAFMESVHAKSYSNIFSTLCSTEDINQLFRWVHEDRYMAKQADILHRMRKADNPVMKVVASVFLESMLFYTGFFAPLKFAANGYLTNTADIIRLILRDEGVHGYYFGAKAQSRFPELLHNAHDEVYGYLFELLEVEYRRCEQLYDDVGWTEEVKAFLRYNANKALANLGFAPAFSPQQTTIPSYIKAALDPGTGETHDFFSGAGASYVMGKAEETTEEDWSW